MIAAIVSATVVGTTGSRVTVEVHVGPGLPGFSIVGLPDEACRESRDRVRAALLSAGFRWPAKRVTVNLAPSGIRKAGSVLDLAIAAGVLVADEQLAGETVEGLGFVGELGLDGTVRPVAGVAPMVAAMQGVTPVVPPENAPEARIATAGPVRVVSCLGELAAALSGHGPWPDPPPADHRPDRPRVPDLADVRGQPVARLALEIAAAGRHPLLLVGPPGSGKTMLAERLPGLLGPLPREHALEVTMVHSAAGVLTPAGGLVEYPPFRAPHHTATAVSLVGGTAAVRPGEVSLAHRGVLFLDELAEFPASVLDTLRQPIEQGFVRISRARAAATMPAAFLLVAATNPCACGGGAPGECSCTEGVRARYLRRLSGPLLDRFDLRVPVHRPAADELLGPTHEEPTAVVRARVALAEATAASRQPGPNGALTHAELDLVAPLTPQADRLLRHEVDAGRLSGRGLVRVRRVARTIADLGGEPGPLSLDHVALALHLRVSLAGVIGPGPRWSPDVAPAGTGGGWAA
jgi:magnesium chelatase family protein